MPKQFIPLIGQRSTFQTIVGVVSDPAVFDPAVVITNFDYRFRVAEQLREIGAEAEILLEPERRDSAAAVSAAAAWAAARDPKAVVAVLAADHVFEDGKKFAALCAQAHAAADAGEIVTFGVTPDHPATGYGYIHPGPPLALDRGVRRIERFVEKPDEARARAFIEEGYLWNSGNFVFRADVMLEELQRFEPEMRGCNGGGGVGCEEGPWLCRPRPRVLRQGAEDIDRLCGDGAHRQGGGVDGRCRMVGRRRVVDGLASQLT